MSTLVLFLTTSFVFSQKNTPFTENKKIYVKGVSRLIGNTIVGQHELHPFNSLDKGNDEVDITYVDIDYDLETFSSSKSNIEAPSSNATVVYAGLYWGGLYPSQTSTMRKGKRKMKYKALGERDNEVQNILLKTNEDAYTSIKGKVIFDSEGKGIYGKESPYVCYADVTDYLKEQKTLQSVTVANIRATQGFIEGGAAAGWMLYVVYEDVSKPATYFSTYDGFHQINKEEVVLNFNGFKTKNSEKVNASIAIAVLEGDRKIKGDVCAIYNENLQAYTPLFSGERVEKNFFNSTITMPFKEQFIRTPASTNTLGLDLLKMSLPDSIITNKTEKTSLQLKTKADRFYPFFIAFETEIEENYLQEKNPAALIKSVVETSVSMAPPAVVDFINPQEVATIVSEEEKQEQDITAVKIDEQIKKQRPSTPLKKILAEGVTNGYYLITNVFSEVTNATKWESRLNEEGYKARTFINYKNNYHYVYVENNENLQVVKSRWEILKQIPFFRKVWIAKVENVY